MTDNPLRREVASLLAFFFPTSRLTMHRRLPLLLRAIAYGLRGGFLIRPFVIALVLGAVGGVLSSLEEQVPTLSAWVPTTLFPSRQDPQVAQVILSAIATSIMTVVSIVFAILLMTLTLASTQFSPRILVSFVRDRGTQWTLGVFLGTFSYCMAALPAARSLPVAVRAGAHRHRRHAAGAGRRRLADLLHPPHLAGDQRQPHRRSHRAGDRTGDRRTDAATARPVRTDEPAAAGRYGPHRDPEPALRLCPLRRHRSVAVSGKSWRIRIRVERGVGQFVPAGVPLLHVSREDRIDPLRAAELLGAFDIGPTRTLQQDVEFGVIQIVDIALRAISPAINDPSTAISCIDQLSRVLIRWLGRAPPASVLFDPPHVPRVFVPWISVDGMLDTAFEQIRHYAANDAAVSLRLLRAIGDIAGTLQQDDTRAKLLERARRVVDGCGERLGEAETARLRQRIAALERLLEG